MAVKVRETRLKLKAYFVDESSGTDKTKVFTINDINPEATNEHLYSLASALNPLIEGSFSKAVRGEDQILANEA